MLGLPASTEINRQLPKGLVYAKFGLNAAQRERFDADISRLVMVHEVSPAALNIQAGQEVPSFFVLRVLLKRAEYDGRNLEMIARLIPQRLLFLLEWAGKGQLAVWQTRLLFSPWAPLDALSIPLNGLNLDAVWQNIVLQVGGLTLASGRTLDEQILIDEEREAVLVQIEKLEKLARAEKQPKKKYELVQEAQRLKRRNEEIEYG